MTFDVQKDSFKAEDYQRIAKAIAFIRSHYLEQPDLATLSQVVNLSESHFQRLFTKWAGISPKRFIQYLTLESAKSKIVNYNNLLDVTLEIGLSSPGRLHDLFVQLEAMSPGEFKAQGKGLEIYYGLHDTCFGVALIALTSRGICHLSFHDQLDNPEQLLQLDWSQATLIYAPQKTQTICTQIFTPVTPETQQPLTVLVKGTNFQIQVWRALLNIPFGGLTSYRKLAVSLGYPQGARAIGQAVGNNRIAYLIPCHRVIRESGELGGYRWGLERKQVMIDWEKSWQELREDEWRNSLYS